MSGKTSALTPCEALTIRSFVAMPAGDLRCRRTVGPSIRAVLFRLTVLVLLCGSGLPRSVPVRAMALLIRTYARLLTRVPWVPDMAAAFTLKFLNGDRPHRSIFYHEHIMISILLIVIQ